MEYGILIIGNGKRKAYSIRQLIQNGSNPVNGKGYKSLEKAIEEAKKLGIEIKKIGGTYELI